MSANTIPHGSNEAESRLVAGGVRLREDLKKRAKIAAIEHNTSLQDIVNEGVELRLAQLEKPGIKAESRTDREAGKVRGE